MNIQFPIGHNDILFYYYYYMNLFLPPPPHFTAVSYTYVFKYVQGRKSCGEWGIYPLHFLTWGDDPYIYSPPPHFFL